MTTIAAARRAERFGTSDDRNRATRALQGLNLFMADRAGGEAERFRTFLRNKRILILAATLAFYILGSFALVSLVLWVGFAAAIRGACEGKADMEQRA